MCRVTSLFFLLVLTPGVCLAQAEKPLLLRTPTVSRDQIAFAYAGDLWIVGREGGDGRRLTTGVGREQTPLFSPDGTVIAFTGEYEGNVDVYTVPAAGGVPRRLTYHPGTDVAVGWHPDGKQILFRSTRHSFANVNRLFTLPVNGVSPVEVPLPMAEEGCYSPDGTRLAYVPLARAFSAWKRYRGGRATPLWIAQLSDSQVEKVPRKDSNDFNPMWVGDKVYFLSDRAGQVTLFVYDTRKKAVTQALKNDGLDLKAADDGPGAIVYEQFGVIHLYDLAGGKSRPVRIQVNGDLPELRPRFERVAGSIRNFGLSPTGARALFEARGEILSVPAEKGDARNLTNTSGTAERDPAWSPDGKWIAYLSDESGEYALHLRDQTGRGEVRKIPLGDPPSFYYTPTWSPDSKRIALTDRRVNLWIVDVEKRSAARIDTNIYDDRSLQPNWSPDSRWLAYLKRLKNQMGAVFVHSLETGRNHQVTDGMSDAAFPAFDRSGKYLYFTASTDAGPTLNNIDMSTYNRPVTRSVYVVVLRKDLPSPIAPESDEEKIQAPPDSEMPPLGVGETGAAQPDKASPGETPSRGGPAGARGQPAPPPDVRIDLESIDQRVLGLPIPARNYSGLSAGKTGILFLTESPPVGAVGVTGRTLHRFDLNTRKTERFLDSVGGFVLSHNGEKMLYRQASAQGAETAPGRGGQGSAQFAIVGTGQTPSGSAGRLNLEGMEVSVDPRAEWRQMYREVWRIERDFFYDPNHHGLDLKAAERRYEPYLEHLASRADLNYLFQEMLGELSVGHLYVSGGDGPEVRPVRGGLLGADDRIENGRYRFAHIYNGENWNPQLRAPLTQPGVNVAVGDYLLAVNGRDVRSTDNIYRFFQGTAGKQVVIKVGPTADGQGAREVTVVPVESEVSLRHLSWIEGNRRQVSKLSGGRLAYMYLPNTGMGGYTAFNRYFFAQTDKEGAVIDERFNGGGSAADYIIDYLSRPLLNYWSSRYGADITSPVGIFGPKAMIINEYAGSGGDLMPWYFRKTGLGPLIGKRTWGGLVGIGGYPTLIDGGTVTAPHFAFWNPEGDWEVENRGVAPDIEVDYDPKAWRSGRDPQLEKAVEVVLGSLLKNPLPRHKKPGYPDYHRTPAPTQSRRQ